MTRGYEGPDVHRCSPDIDLLSNGQVYPRQQVQGQQGLHLFEGIRELIEEAETWGVGVHDAAPFWCIMVGRIAASWEWSDSGWSASAWSGEGALLGPSRISVVDNGSRDSSPPLNLPVTGICQMSASVTYGISAFWLEARQRLLQAAVARWQLHQRILGRKITL
jgi:hypothetical protein